MELHLNQTQLEKGFEDIVKAPNDGGILEMIVCRPSENERIVLNEGELSTKLGLVGDNWIERGSSKTSDGSSHPHMQINIMNSRAIHLIAREKDRWPLAGDQLYIDMNLSEENLPAGSKLSIGSAIIEITEIPHNGCKKFAQRFGVEAVKFVNSPKGKEHHLRGVNAKVVKGGIFKVGDRISKIK